MLRAGRRPAALWAASVGVSLLAGFGAAGQDAGPGMERDLYLEVFINETATGLITHFRELPNGGLVADGQELANTGILPVTEGQQGEIRVDQLPGVTYRIDEEAQTLHFQAVEVALAAKVISAAPEAVDKVFSEDPDEDEQHKVHTGYGVVLNYNITLEAHLGQDALAGSHFASADFDARIFLPVGALSHSFALSQAAQGSEQSYVYRRLDTFWRTALPGRASQVQIGDITTRGPSWARPVRLGGILIERNFDLRPDLVTIPLPSFEGSALVPSTVDVYSDSIRRFSAEVPAGPFTLNDLPFGTGSGDAQVVVRDVKGRETRIDLPFLVSSDLMRKGIFDYALALGHPRLGIGTVTDRYGDGFFGAATLRFGLTDGITLALHAEGGEDLRMGGIAATFRVGTLGTATVSVADSRSASGQGTLAEVQAGLSFGRLRVSGRMMRTMGDFVDIARATAEVTNPDSTLSGALVSLNQIAISLPLAKGRRGANASVFYADTRRAGEEPDTSLGIAYSQQIFKDSTLSLSALAVEGETSDVILGLGLHIPLSKRVSVGATLEHRDGDFHQTLSASGRPEEPASGWAWRMQVTREAHASVQASAGREFRHGTVEFGTRLSQTEQSVGLRLEGALVASGGGLFAANRVNDAFAVVDAGAPDVDVMFENRSAGTTGRSGKLLLPDLRSYDLNNISIDPATLPLDADVPGTTTIVRPAHRSGVKVDFAVTTNPASAIVELVTLDGAPMPVGLTAVLAGTGESFLIGYDGMVYALGLDARNEFSVRNLDGTECLANFDYTDEPGTISQIKGVVCQWDICVFLQSCLWCSSILERRRKHKAAASRRPTSFSGPWIP